MTSGIVVHHRQFGPAMPSLNWVPAPRYILRRDRVLELLRDQPPGKVLDIGCGPGALISELAARGFDVIGVDRSTKARALGRHLQDERPTMQLHATLDEAWKGSFDLLLSFEVIEHVPDDLGALREWREYLKPGGRMIISTPAHAKHWNAADEWAGHVRRYDRRQLFDVVQAAGFEVERIECYGFPMANVMEEATAPSYRRRLDDKKQDFTEADALTDDSGSDRAVHSRIWPIYSSLIPAALMKIACLAQRPFLKTNLGRGFIVIAKAA